MNMRKIASAKELDKNFPKRCIGSPQVFSFHLLAYRCRCLCGTVGPPYCTVLLISLNIASLKTKDLSSFCRTLNRRSSYNKKNFHKHSVFMFTKVKEA